MNRFFYALLVLTFAFIITSCGDSGLYSTEDFREQWVGTYEGTKSNSSFEDTMFTTEVEFEVAIDEASEDGLIVNGINFPIDEDGTFGPGFLNGGGTNYELIIDDDELRLQIGELIPNGIALACFIIATRN